MLNKIIDFLLNSWEHCDSEATAKQELAVLIDNQPVAEKAINAWLALEGQQRARLSVPMLNDSLIRSWLLNRLAA